MLDVKKVDFNINVGHRGLSDRSVATTYSVLVLLGMARIQTLARMSIRPSRKEIREEIEWGLFRCRKKTSARRNIMPLSQDTTVASSDGKGKGEDEERMM